MDGSQRSKVDVSPGWRYLWVVPAVILERLDSLNDISIHASEQSG